MTPEDLRAEVERVRAKHWGDYDPDPSTLPERVATTCAECLDPHPCDAYRLAGALLAVLRLHRDDTQTKTKWCGHCDKPWPCPTVSAAVQEMEER